MLLGAVRRCHPKHGVSARGNMVCYNDGRAPEWAHCKADNYIPHHRRETLSVG